MTICSQEELAQFLRLNRLLRGVRLEPFRAPLIHGIELFLSSAAHLIESTAILSVSIELLLAAHAVPASSPHKASATPSVTEAPSVVAEAVPTEATPLVTTSGVEPAVVVAATRVVVILLIASTSLVASLVAPPVATSVVVLEMLVVLVATVIVATVAHVATLPTLVLAIGVSVRG